MPDMGKPVSFRIVPRPVACHRGEAANTGRELDLQPAFSSQVARVLCVLTFQTLRYAIQIVDDLVLGQRPANVPGDVVCEVSVGATKEKISPATSQPVAVHSDHDVTVIDEGCELL